MTEAHTHEKAIYNIRAEISFSGSGAAEGKKRLQSARFIHF